jgi:chloramphenicol 3-O phosphotransferase
MAVQVIVLNGVSSAGKSTLARALQDALPEEWLTFGIDTLITGMPWRMSGQPEGLVFEDDGRVIAGPTFLAMEAQWREGIAAIARAGARIILDEVMLGGAGEQARWREVLAGLEVLWVGVTCDPAVAAEREAARPDRVPGMAASQAPVVHAGVAYDIVADTSLHSAAECAEQIAAKMWRGLKEPHTLAP